MQTTAVSDVGSSLELLITQPDKKFPNSKKFNA